ncbi:MAG: hypothetical protein M3R70_11260 [Actinomycetota bacterium]|nr:hypothetical protein [Actinomycetota bacterium]
MNITPAPAISWAPLDQLLHGLLTRNSLVTLAREFIAGERAILVRLRGLAKQYSIDLARPVATTRARAPYRLSGFFRTHAPGATLCLRVQEVTGDNKIVTSTERCFAPKANWRKYSVRSRSLAGGHRLLVSAYEFGAQRGDSFELGGVSTSAR